jgi:DNA-binding NtrC family response regulator
MERADGGTLFLDEISDMPLELQVKLLKAIEDRAFRRIGGDREINIDVQVIAASNRDLEQSARDGAFRNDLYHRLSVFRLDLPPLRKRKDDLADLVPLFVAEYNTVARKRVKVIQDGTWKKLRSYDWPGNVRELRNVVERCVLFAEAETFPEQWLQLGSVDMESEIGEPHLDGHWLALPLDGSMALEEMDRYIIKTALERNDFNTMATARSLGTTRETLRYRIHKYGLTKKDHPPERSNHPFLK